MLPLYHVILLVLLLHISKEHFTITPSLLSWSYSLPGLNIIPSDVQRDWVTFDFPYSHGGSASWNRTSFFHSCFMLRATTGLRTTPIPVSGVANEQFWPSLTGFFCCQGGFAGLGVQGLLYLGWPSELGGMGFRMGSFSFFLSVFSFFTVCIFLWLLPKAEYCFFMFIVFKALINLVADPHTVLYAYLNMFWVARPIRFCMWLYSYSYVIILYGLL